MRKIAIIGGDRISRIDMPKTRKGSAADRWEFWSCNNLYIELASPGCAHRECKQLSRRKFDRWFELHTFKKRISGYTRRDINTYSGVSVKEYMEELSELEIPVYMQQKWNIIPKSVKFPFDDIMKHFGSYFGCSFAWMLAFALYEHINAKNEKDKIKTIGLWGVELKGLEYYIQRPSMEYYIGLARGMGIEVIISKQGGLCAAPWIYAYKEDHKKILEIYTNHNIPEMRVLLAFQQAKSISE